MTDRLGLVHNEFAAVELSIDREGHDPRLRIEDVKTGHVGYLAWRPERSLEKLLDPSHSRWVDER
jgi:hypothetical protein